MGQEPENLGSFDGDIICEPPNNHLNKFEGTLTWKGKRYELCQGFGVVEFHTNLFEIE